jgi:hypothetical protein
VKCIIAKPGPRIIINSSCLRKGALSKVFELFGTVSNGESLSRFSKD